MTSKRDRHSSRGSLRLVAESAESRTSEYEDETEVVEGGASGSVHYLGHNLDTHEGQMAFYRDWMTLLEQKKRDVKEWLEEVKETPDPEDD